MADEMSLADEMAEARRKIPEPTRAHIIEGARFDMTNPDTSLQYKVTLIALFDEIDLGKQRLDVAIRYAGRLLFNAAQQESTMENQHQQIKGYRDLSQAEIDLINRCKAMAEDVGKLAEEVKELPENDMRWASIGITQLQQGFMALIRSIAKPTTF